MTFTHSLVQSECRSTSICYPSIPKRSSTIYPSLRHSVSMASLLLQTARLAASSE
jgi:hypothetical protein